MDGLQGKVLGRPQAGGALNAAALDRRLRLKSRAREDGARNQPRSDTHDLSQAEQQIVELVAGERARVDQARIEIRTEAERRLRALAPAPQDFSGPALEARLALKQVAGRVGHDWAAAAARSARAEADLEDFRKTHGLRRGAFYPRSPILQTGLLFAAALFESLFSAALFAEDDARGLLGGAVTAIGLSGANVTLGFLAGFLGLRYLQHTRLPIKVAGACGFALLTALALMLNLFAADWRDRMAALAGALPDRGADSSFHIWSLLQLDSPQAIILLMLGAGVWVFAALKGYSGFDDPYPEYGQIDRAAQEMRDGVSAFRNEARRDLEAPLDAARATLAARMDKMRAEFDAMSKAFDAAALDMQALDAQARALDDAAATAVQLYRQENLAARTTPAPAYFALPPPAAGPALDALGGCAAMIDEARRLIADSQRQSAQALEDLAADLEAAQSRLDSAA